LRPFHHPEGNSGIWVQRPKWYVPSMIDATWVATPCNATSLSVSYVSSSSEYLCNRCSHLCFSAQRHQTCTCPTRSEVGKCPRIIV
jgi:hypothetical protein